MYYVFKRSDGHVGAINCSEKVREGKLPTRLQPYGVSENRTSFVVLLQSDDWDECANRIKVERAKRAIAQPNASPLELVIDETIFTSPPADPDEIDRRTCDDIKARLASINRALKGAHAEIVDLHGQGSPTQVMAESALIMIANAIRFNEEKSQ